MPYYIHINQLKWVQLVEINLAYNFDTYLGQD